MIKVENTLRDPRDDQSVVRVLSHWNYDTKVILEIDIAGKVTQIEVYAADLIAAIKNATNTNRFEWECPR